MSSASQLWQITSCIHVLYTVGKPGCMAIQRTLNRNKRTSSYRVMTKIAPEHHFWKQFCKSLYISGLLLGVEESPSGDTTRGWVHCLPRHT